MKTVPFLFAIDKNLIMQTCVCLSSLLRHADSDTFYDIFIIYSDDYDISKTQIAELPSHYGNCRLNFKPFKSDLEGLYEVRGITAATYYRLLAAEIITEYDKILYSDVDVIFRCDQSKYYDIDLGSNCFGAVDNYLELRPDIREYVSDVIKLDPSKGYYYAGNLVMNLKQLREDNVGEKFRELCRLKLSKQDMDIINIACNGRFLPLPPEFCLTVQLYDLLVNSREMQSLVPKESVEFALKYGTIHYNGNKPWDTWCHHQDVWWEEYRKSPFFSEKHYADWFLSRYDTYGRLSLKDRIKLVINYFRK